MTRDDDRRPEAPAGREDGERSGQRDAGVAEDREAGRDAGPTPEEAPELLGEQSDYPIAWEPSPDEGHERS